MKKCKIFSLFMLIIVILLLTPSRNSAFNGWDTISYDDNICDYFVTLVENDTFAVRFTPLYENFQLTGVSLYANSSDLAKIRIWVLNDSLDMIMEPHDPAPAVIGPPYDVSFGDLGPIFTSANVSDFYIVLQWITNNTPNFGIGVDSTSNSGRSYINESGSSWQEYANGNIMIRAKIADTMRPTFDHIPLRYAVEGNDVSISAEVIDEFGVESVILKFRKKGSSGSFDAISFTRISGNAQRGIWYGNIPGENVTSEGLEYYIWATDVGSNQQYYGNASMPFEVEVVSMLKIPLVVNIIIIFAISAAAVVLYKFLPNYEGEDIK
ncbi:MAG: hypothetical protein ACFFD2_08770 [Promethearchaeota archaeon]